MERDEPGVRSNHQVGDSLLYARRLRALFDSLPALMAYWDGDLRNVLANAALLKWYGLTPEEIHGRHIRDVLGAELYERDLPHIEAALHGSEQVLERDLTDSTGTVRHTQTTYLPDVVPGESPGFFVVDADITPWVEATRVLDEAQQLAQSGSWVHDVGTDVIVWTDGLYRIFGEDPESFTPTPEAIARRVHPDDAERVRIAQERARTTGEGYDLSYRIVLPNGAVRDVRGREERQQGNGEVVRTIGSVQDMTDINAAARELARVNFELGRINQVNADVLAMLGHDVRAPLTVMLGNLEELVEGWETLDDATRFDRTRRLQRAAQRMEGLVEDILAMASADAGELTPNLADVSVADAVRDALTAVVDGGVQVSVPTGLSVHADPFHLRQVVANLVTNAFRYGEPPVEITAVENYGGTVTVRVRDHGPGVHAAAVPGLFERFAHAGNPKPGVTVGPASGFGLYIAARLATLNHGLLAYEPADPGACFALTLPEPLPDDPRPA